MVVVENAVSHDGVRPNSKDPKDSWWPAGGLTVCCIRWVGSTVENSLDFFSLFRQSMPDGTVVFGCRSKIEKGGNDSLYDYVALVGFSYRYDSWAGLKEHLVLTKSDGQRDTEDVRVRFVKAEVETVESFVMNGRRVIVDNGVDFV